jgi:hypothetical protein
MSCNLREQKGSQMKFFRCARSVVQEKSGSRSLRSLSTYEMTLPMYIARRRLELGNDSGLK